MNSSRFDQILRQVFLVPIIAVLIGAGAMFWQMRQAARTVGDIEKSDDSLSETLLIERLIIDQETGLRGYQTTGDPIFLDSYFAASTQLNASFDRRRRLAVDPSRASLVTDLQSAHYAWEQGFAAPLIASMRAGGQTSDLELNLLGKRQMDGVRRQLNEMIAYTQHRRQAEIRSWRRQLRFAAIGLIVVAVLIGLVIGFFSRRQLQDVSSAFRQSHDILRVRAEQTFRSEQRLRTTLESIGDGVITCDAEGHIDSMNDVAQKLTGWTTADARALPLESVFRIIDAGSRKPLENPVAKVQRLNATVNLTSHTILVRRDGTEIYVDDSGAPIRDKHGNLTGVVLVFRDVTLAVKSQDALLANEKLAVAGRLAATIAHEIHNPLDSVSNLLFLMDGVCTAEESAQFLQLAKQELTRVTQISRAMLSLYRESRAPVEIDLKEMLESILLLMDRRFGSLGVTVKTELPEGLIVHGFPAELRQVFTNLLTNAAEATGSFAPDGSPSAFDGLVHVSGRQCPAGSGPDGLPREAGVQITICDDGHGVPDEALGQLFQPFFTTKGERGTGLGLWVSRGIMTKHGGSIDLASSTHPETHGTTVNVFLAKDPVINPAGA